VTPERVEGYELHEDRLNLDNPVLVVALEGWIDAGLGAVAAAASLMGVAPTHSVATFESGRFIDQRSRRPVAHIVDGITTELNWPRLQLRRGNDRSGRHVLYLVGPEPDFRWDEFTDAVVALAQRLGVHLVVGLGAFPAPAPHTRPVKLAATAPASSAHLVARVGVVQGELEVPAGIIAALELAFGAIGTEVVTLWARVPHYVSAMPFPEASAALVDGLVRISGLDFDPTPLRAAADSARRQVDDLIAGSAEHRNMVRKLEESLDAAEGNPLGVEEVPSGEEIAAELERFLRGEGQ
jgi:predicted ATP-grasp superfamily ATP-dependent carboligase